MMNLMRRTLVQAMSNERGQDMVEYAMMTAFVSIAIIGAAVLVGIPSALTAWAEGVRDCVADPGSCAL